METKLREKHAAEVEVKYEADLAAAMEKAKTAMAAKFAADMAMLNKKAAEEEAADAAKQAEADEK